MVRERNRRLTQRRQRGSGTNNNTNAAASLPQGASPPQGVSLPQGASPPQGMHWVQAPEPPCFGNRCRSAASFLMSKARNVRNSALNRAHTVRTKLRNTIFGYPSTLESLNELIRRYYSDSTSSVNKNNLLHFYAKKGLDFNSIPRTLRQNYGIVLNEIANDTEFMKNFASKSRHVLFGLTYPFWMSILRSDIRLLRGY